MLKEFKNTAKVIFIIYKEANLFLRFITPKYLEHISTFFTINY